MAHTQRAHFVTTDRCDGEVLRFRAKVGAESTDERLAPRNAAMRWETFLTGTGLGRGSAKR